LLRAKTVKTGQVNALVMSAVPTLIASSTGTQAADKVAGDVIASPETAVIFRAHQHEVGN
jgi:hypothetical protein